MKKLTHNSQAMFDNLEAAVNGSELAVGNADAVAHIGMMMQGGLSPETLEDIHAEVLYHEDTSASYVAGYMHMWNTIYNSVFDVA